MSDEDLDFESNGPKALREAYEKQKQEMAALREEFNRLAAERRSTVLASTLKAKGFDEAKAAKVAKFYDGEDTSEDAIGQWLEANADVFGAPQQAPPAAPTPERVAPGFVDPNVQATERVLNATYSEASQSGPTVNGRPLGSPEETAHLINTLPFEQLVEMGLLPKPPRQF